VGCGFCGLLVAGYWLLVTGCWLLVAGCWLLVAGYWLLVAGCWLLVAGLTNNYPIYIFFGVIFNFFWASPCS